MDNWKFELSVLAATAALALILFTPKILTLFV